MVGRTLVILISFGLFFVIEAQNPSPQCGPCDRSSCPEVGSCHGRSVMDVCGCCLMCSRGLGQRCDADPVVTGTYGTCGDYLVCQPRTDIGDTEEATCECESKGAICGSDGITYDTLCHLLEKTTENPQLSVVSRESCKTVPIIKSRPKDALRPPGSIMVLDCEVAGFPVPDLTWELNRDDGSSFKLPSDDSGFAVQIRGGPEKHMVTGWVQIMRITKETVGTYTCVATNAQGEARASAKVSLRASGENENYMNGI